MILSFECPKEILKENLLTVQKAVAMKSSVPQLECYYINAENDTITIIGNNLEISVKTEFSAEVNTEGKALINAKTLLDMVNLMPMGEIEIFVNDDYNVEIKNNRTKYETVAMDTEAYPLNEENDFSYSFKISEGNLKEIIKKTYFSIGNDDKKIILKGASFEISGENLRVVTTDSFRLSVINEEITNATGVYSYIIPGKSLNDLIKIIGDGEDEAEILFGEKSALIKIRNIEFCTRLIEGEFPPYENLIPKDINTKVFVSTKMLCEALERCSLIVTPDAKEPVKLKITDSRIDLLTLSRVGKIEDSVECAKTGDDIEVGFNYKYLLDALKSIEEDQVTLNFKNNLSPCTIKCEDNESFIYLVVPVRLKD